MSSNTDRVALAFSGGLDTTVCVPLLEEEYGYDEVIGVTVDVGQPEEEFDEAEETAANSPKPISVGDWSAVGIRFTRMSRVIPPANAIVRP